MFSHPGCHIYIFWSNGGAQGDGICSHLSPSWTPSAGSVLVVDEITKDLLILAKFSLGRRCTVSLLWLRFYLRTVSSNDPFLPLTGWVHLPPSTQARLHWGTESDFLPLKTLEEDSRFSFRKPAKCWWDTERTRVLATAIKQRPFSMVPDSSISK